MTINVKHAIILAAGSGSRLGDAVDGRPKGLIEIDGEPILRRSLRLLRVRGVETIAVVVGYRAESYMERLRSFDPDLFFIRNDSYDTTGSMHSLDAAASAVGGDFLLLESDLVYEKRALSALLAAPDRDTILVSGKTGAGDEVYVCGDNGRVAFISKSPPVESTPVGELVGISRITAALFFGMCRHYRSRSLGQPRYDYENCISDIAGGRNVAYLRIDDLVWAEIDDAKQLNRVRQAVYPLIRERDAKP